MMESSFYLSNIFESFINYYKLYKHVDWPCLYKYFVNIIDKDLYIKNVE